RAAGGGGGVAPRVARPAEGGGRRPGAGVAAGAGPEGRPAAREGHREGGRDFANQARRMGCPSYRAPGGRGRGGPVGSACKAAVGQRRKGGGMRWGADGAGAVCPLRALIRSSDGQWGASWSRN